MNISATPDFKNVKVTAFTGECTHRIDHDPFQLFPSEEGAFGRHYGRPIVILTLQRKHAERLDRLLHMVKEKIDPEDCSTWDRPYRYDSTLRAELELHTEVWCQVTDVDHKPTKIDDTVCLVPIIHHMLVRRKGKNLSIELHVAHIFTHPSPRFFLSDQPFANPQQPPQYTP